MKFRIALTRIALLAGYVMWFPVFAQGNATDERIFALPTTVHELNNGLRVVVVETDYPDIVDLQIVVQTGVRNETEPGKSGFAHFFEHMMYRGTERYPTAAYVQAVKKAGAEWNASTTDDYSRFYMTFTKADLAGLLELEADRFKNLNYSEEGFRTEAVAIKGEYLSEVSNPLLAAFYRARALAFPSHPYGHTTIGLLEDIEQMPEQYGYSKTFFERWYRPEYTTLVISGDVEANETLALVEAHWADWPRGTYEAATPAEAAPEGPLYEHMQWESDTSPWLLIGFRSPAFVPGEKDVAALQLLQSVYFSNSSDLYQQLVLDEQLLSELGTDFPLNKDPNLNLIYMQLTDVEHAPAVERAVLQSLAKAKSELIEDEMLSRTKSNLRYAFAAELDRSASIGTMLSTFVAFDRSPQPVNDLYAAYAELSSEDVRRYARQYFTDASRVTVSLSESAQIEGIGIAELPHPPELDRPLDQAASAQRRIPTDASLITDSGGESVRIIEHRFPSSSLIDVSILIHSGAAADPPGKEGLAALTAAMIADAGSADFSIQEINAAMYPLASGFTATVDKEMTRLSGQVHRDNLETWYAYVKSQVFQPGWRAADFERLKGRQASAIQSDLVTSNDEELAKELLYAEIYGERHPYGFPNAGRTGSIAALDIEDVKAFYGEHYVVNNITVGLSGGYPQRLVDWLARDFRLLPEGESRTRQIPAAPESDASRATIIAKETDAVAVSFGFPIDLKRGDPDWVALWLVRSFLGEHRSDNSLLYQRIREQRGLNYGDYAYIEYFPDGMFRLQPDTNKARQQQIFQVWIRPLENNSDAHFATRTAIFELQKLVAEGMSENAFVETREFLSRFVSLITDGQSRQLGYALDSDYYGIESFSDYVRDGLASLTLDDVNRVIRENLNTRAVHYVFVTRDADDMRQRLVDNLASPPNYAAAMPSTILEEDKLIEQVDLGIDAAQLSTIAADELFR